MGRGLREAWFRMASKGGSAPSLYAILGLNKDSSDVEIRSAYRKLAKKWHPDKWSNDPSLAEQAKLRFQEIQEAYSVLSDDTKRTMYDAGVYESEDDVDGFSDFLDEMATMMANVRDQSNTEDSFEELQQAFLKMVNDNCFSSDGFQQFEPPSEKEGSKCENNDFLNEDMGDEWWGDDTFCDLMNEDMGDESSGDYTFYDPISNLHAYDDDLYSTIENHHQIAQGKQDPFVNNGHKKPRICTAEGTDFEIYSFRPTPELNSYSYTAFVA